MYMYIDGICRFEMTMYMKPDENLVETQRSQADTIQKIYKEAHGYATQDKVRNGPFKKWNYFLQTAVNYICRNYHHDFLSK